MQFARYLLRRAGYSILVLLGLSIIIFGISRVLPGDPARMALGPYASQEQVQALTKQLQLDRPIYTQYGYYLWDVLHGDFGQSLVTERNVLLDIAHYLPATFELILVTIFWVITIGTPLGALSAKYKDTWLDNFTRLLSFFGVVTPAFLIGILSQLIFGYGLNVLPVTGRLSPSVTPPPNVSGFLLLDSLIALNFPALLNAFLHLLLPSFSLAFAGIAQVTRITRSSMIDVEKRDFVEAARGFGIPDFLITWKYMLKPAFIPTMNVAGLTFASLFGNAFLVEMVFSWPGIAKYGMNAVFKKDLNAITGVILVIGIAFVVTNFFVDLATGYFDPRIRLKGQNQ